MDTGVVIRFTKFAGTVEMAQQVKGDCGRSWLPRPSFIRRWDPHDGRREQTKASLLLSLLKSEHRRAIDGSGWS